MIKYRLRILGITMVSVFLFFAVRAWFWLHGLLTNAFFAGDSEEAIFDFAIRDGGYFGSFEQVLIGTIIIALAVEYAVPKENAVYLVRYPKRSSYLSVRLVLVVCICIGIIICKFLTAYCFMVIQFDSQLMFSEELLRRFLSGILLDSIYTVRCGIIYMIIRDLLNKKTLAMGITILIYFFEFYIYVENLFGLNIEQMWMPFRDLTASFGFMCGEISGAGLLLVTIRQIGMTLLCLLLWGKVWKGKDVIRLER